MTALTVSPGADTVLVIRNASRGGLRDGMVTTFGICSGLFLHASVSAVGISMIVLQSAQLFMALKIAGALYLIWLGWKSLRAAVKRKDDALTPDDRLRGFDLIRSGREGLLSNVLNPKPIVFYMAFLPQFIDPAGSALAQSLLLASIHFAISVAWLGLVALMVDRARVWLMQGSVKRWLDGGVGAVLALLGAGLAASALQAER